MDIDLTAKDSWRIKSQRTGRRSMAIIVPAYIGAIACSEAMLVFWGTVPGLVCHALLVVVLYNHYILMSRASYQEYGDPNALHWFTHTLLVLALAPLLRIFSLTMPTTQIPQIYWHAMIGAPLLLTVALMARLLGLSWSNLGLDLRSFSWAPQVLIASSGLPLGMAAFLIVRPKPLVARLDWLDIVIASAILLIFSGFTEELIFRGLLQRAIVEIFGHIGVVWSSLLFAAMFIGSLSLHYMLFVGLVGIFFGWCVHRTGSIWGVALAHSLLNIGMLLVYPYYLAVPQ